MRALPLACRARGARRIHSSSRSSVRRRDEASFSSWVSRWSFCSQPGRVVALPGDAGAAVELEDPARHVVEEVAVVRDRDHAARELLQEALEPGHRLGVEVVRGLVEQQHVGGLQQQAAQSDAALLAAGERRDVRVAGRQPQRVHRDLDLLVEVPQVLRVDLVLQARELVGRVVRVVRRDLLVALDDLLLLGHRFHHVLEHVLRRIEHWLLRQVADARALRGEGLAREVLVDAGHDAQQRRLARAVRAEHADLRVAVERQPDALQDLLALRGDLAQVLHGEDELGHAVSRLLCLGWRRGRRPTILTRASLPRGSGRQPQTAAGVSSNPVRYLDASAQPGRP